MLIELVGLRSFSCCGGGGGGGRGCGQGVGAGGGGRGGGQEVAQTWKHHVAINTIQ